MEIRGLEAYIEAMCPQVKLDVNIRESGDFHKTLYKDIEPVLLVDGNSCSHWLYETISNNPGAHLGLYKEFEKRCQNLINAFKENSIRTVFIFDGYPTPTNDSDAIRWIKRNDLKIQAFYRARSIYGIPLPHEVITKAFKSDIETTEFFKYILRFNGCEIMQSVNGISKEIMRFIVTEKSCFGILAQASHFIGFDIKETLFSVKHLNLETLDTVEYNRQMLASHLHIRDKEYFFPLLATLCGNDFLSDDDLFYFHVSLFDEYNATKDFESWNIPPSTTMPPIAEVAKWIAQNSQQLSTEPESWVARLSSIFELPQLRENIACSIRYYSTTTARGKSAQSKENGVWSQILDLAEERHRRQGLHGSIYSVMSHLKDYYKYYYVDMFTPGLPSCSRFVRPLLRRMYSILLKDRSINEVRLISDQVIQPIPLPRVQNELPPCPSYHPGLLKLWGDSTAKEQMTMLCWAVSSNLQLQDLLMIPEKLRIACLALFYIVEKGLGCCEFVRDCPLLDNLIMVIVVLYKKPYVNPINDVYNQLPTAKEVRIANLYTHTWFQVLAAHDVCGSPLLNDNNKVNSVFFDGKLFHIACTQRLDSEVTALDRNDFMYWHVMCFLEKAFVANEGAVTYTLRS